MIFSIKHIKYLLKQYISKFKNTQQKILLWNYLKEYPLKFTVHDSMTRAGLTAWVNQADTWSSTILEAEYSTDCVKLNISHDHLLIP
jgi:hypothetical protein